MSMDPDSDWIEPADRPEEQLREAAEFGQMACDESDVFRVAMRNLEQSGCDVIRLLILCECLYNSGGWPANSKSDVRRLLSTLEQAQEELERVRFTQAEELIFPGA